MTETNNLDKLDNTEPNIVKEEDYNLMLELIEGGLWRGVNLSKALGVSEETIGKWKKRKEAVEAHRKSIIKYLRRRTDVEAILKELDIQSDPDITALVQNNYYQLDDGQLDSLIQSKISQAGIGRTLSGKAATDAGESAEVRKPTPEAA